MRQTDPEPRAVERTQEQARVAAAEESSDAHLGKRAARVAGLLAATLGLVVLVGWFTHTEVLIQVLPKFAPMQFNTALGFVLCGTALAVLVRGDSRVAVSLAAAAGTLGLLTLVEYACGIRLGIDEFFFDSYITVQTSHVGRMAPNTALCFLLSSVALVAAARSKQPGPRFWIVGAISVVLLSFGSIALLGYVTAARSAYGWGLLTRMAVHTSSGFVLLAVGLLALAFRDGVLWAAASSTFHPDRQARERRKIVVASVCVMALVSIAVGLTTLRELYSTGLEIQRVRLSDMVKNRIRMIDAVARYDAVHSRDLPGGAAAATLSQVVDALEGSSGFGQTGEFLVARREGEGILFIVQPRHAGPEFDQPVSLESALAEPMKRALDGQSDTIVAFDYRGQDVLAAYAPLASLELGIVAKMDMDEVRAPFVRAAQLTAAIALVIIAIGAGASWLSIDPLARRVELQALALHLVNVELKREAAEREESVRELSERESMLEGIYQTYPDLQFVLDADGTIVRYSSAEGTDLFVPPDVFLGQRMQDVLPPAVAELWVDAFRRATKQRAMQTFEYSLSMSEATRDFEARVNIMPDGRFIAIARDITERRQAEESVRQLNISLESRVTERTAELEEANKELEAFAYSVSHDLKAPLRAIDGYSAMLQESHGPSLPSDGQRGLRVIRENAQQMARLIDDLLAFSRIGRAEMAIHEVDMRELAQAVFSDLMRLESERVVEFSVGDLPTVPGDLPLLRQVWTNLLQNALKFTKGREVARIDVDYEEDADHLIFSVRDNGAGFDMAYVDKLFGVFQRLHYQEDFPGSGVGLAIVQRVVRRHGGEAWASGEVDAGATIRFRLPAKRVET